MHNEQIILFEDYVKEISIHNNLNYNVQQGDLWQLGDHYIMCGDSTNQLDVQSLLRGHAPRLMVTDPPYGVNYDPSWRDTKYTLNKTPSKRRTGVVLNDCQSNWSQSFELSPAEVAYVWCSSMYSRDTEAALENTNFILKNQIIWVKPAHAISRGYYHWQHELLWYAVKKYKKAEWIGGRSQTTIWKISNRIDFLSKYLNNHSTIKPIDCMMRPIQNHLGDVYDPFVGTGTTIIAATIQQRRCFAMEIDPHYVEIAIARWENYTQQQALKIYNNKEDVE